MSWDAKADLSALRKEFQKSRRARKMYPRRNRDSLLRVAILQLLSKEGAGLSAREIMNALQLTNSGWVFLTLTRLESAGCVNRREVPQPNRPNRFEYTVA